MSHANHYVDEASESNGRFFPCSWDTCNFIGCFICHKNFRPVLAIHNRHIRNVYSSDFLVVTDIWLWPVMYNPNFLVVTGMEEILKKVSNSDTRVRHISFHLFQFNQFQEPYLHCVCSPTLIINYMYMFSSYMQSHLSEYEIPVSDIYHICQRLMRLAFQLFLSFQ